MLYASFSVLWISNLGYRPLSHEDLSSRFANTLNSASVAVVHVVNAVVSIPVDVIHLQESIQQH